MPLPFTIVIDDRAGSQYAYLGRDREKVDLADFFRKHREQPIVQINRLIAGDFCFSGHGPKGPVMVGVERKTTKDMLSSMRSGRFSGEQLPKLLDQYEFIYLVVEGKYRTNWQTGILEEPYAGSWRQVMVGTQNFVGLELASFLNSLTLRSPIKIHHTLSFADTVEYILTLAYTFSKPWDRHTAHLAIHSPEPYAMVEKASAVRRFAYAMTKVGWVLSGNVEQQFRSVAEMVLAGHPELVGLVDEVKFRQEFEKIDGFGKALSGRIWKELYGVSD